MASSTKDNSSKKRGTGVVKERSIKSKNPVCLKPEIKEVVESKKIKKSRTVKKSDIQKVIDQKNAEGHKIRDFIKKLQTTIKIENKKLSEIEGAVIALFELMTGEKVED